MQADASPGLQVADLLRDHAERITRCKGRCLMTPLAPRKTHADPTRLVANKISVWRTQRGQTKEGAAANRTLHRLLKDPFEFHPVGGSPCKCTDERQENLHADHECTHRISRDAHGELRTSHVSATTSNEERFPRLYCHSPREKFEV